MTKKYDDLLKEQSIRDSFAYVSQGLSKNQPTIQQLADAFKRFSTLMKGLKRNDRLSDCANKCL